SRRGSRVRVPSAPPCIEDQGEAIAASPFCFLITEKISQDLQDYAGLTGLKTQKLYALIL
ncbi:MAG: hypothetical protein AAB294_04470, partial [Pseudomonadota bacterium]